MAEKKEIRKYIFGKRKEFTQQEAEKYSEKTIKKSSHEA